ncbi:MAG TPA: mechanosensitive ion channel [Nannocystis exedens]|nr:mechanosensitive ion channel [Nannocystis exedens]
MSTLILMLISLSAACSGGQAEEYSSADQHVAEASAGAKHSALSDHEHEGVSAEPVAAEVTAGSAEANAGHNREVAGENNKSEGNRYRRNDNKRDENTNKKKHASAVEHREQADNAQLAGTAAPAAVGSEQAPASLAEQFTADLRAIRDRLGVASILMLVALIGLAWLTTQLIPWLVRLGYRLGMRHTRFVDNFGMLGRFAIWAWVLMVILLRAWRIAPMITLLATALVASGLMVGLVKHFENLSTGFGLALHGRIKIGDQITVGEHMGMVRHIGLMHIQIRTPEGMVYLPNRLLAGEALLIGRSRNSYPLRARLTASHGWPPEALEVARCIAALSPYRDVNSRVNIQSEADDERVLLVEIQVWSPRLLDAADRHLRSMLAANLRGMVRDQEESYSQPPV